MNRLPAARPAAVLQRLRTMIQRRDFLNGLALALGAGAAPAAAAIAAASPAPAGRVLSAPGEPGSSSTAAWAGQTDTAMERGHLLRDPPQRWQAAAVELDEVVEDLVVVGAGLSGLAGAWTYARHAGRGARILILDPLDEPGGHAQRNEFVSRAGRRLVGYGGSQSLDSPGLFSPAVHEVLAGIGIELERFETEFFDATWTQRHQVEGSAVYFDPRAWSRETVVIRRPGELPAEWLQRSPLSAAGRDAIVALGTPILPAAWPWRTAAATRSRLAAITYAEFLTRHRRVPAEVLTWFHASTMGYFGVGIDATSALDAAAFGLPGFAGLSLGDGLDPRVAASARMLHASEDDYVYHFPDGNAGVVRALLRSLRPELVPGTGMETLSTAALPRDRLDAPDAAVRLRLGATALWVRHLGPPGHAELAEVRYRDAAGRLRAVRARHVLLACWHRAVARMSDELPREQVRALDEQVKTPLVYATVLVSDWWAWRRAGISSIRSPGGFWQEAGLDFPVSLGGLRFPEHPDEPMLLHFGKVVVPGDGRSPREQAQAGREQLLGWRFEDFEDEIRRVLGAVLGPHGFDADRDLEAITVNRWAHGYAYEYARPWDRHWPRGPLPHERARRGWGRVAIANSDSGAYAYAHSAIDQAVRAVGELLPAAHLPAWSRFPGPYAPLSPAG